MSYGQVNANRSYREDHAPADDAFERIAWPRLQSVVGGFITNAGCLNSPALGQVGKLLDVYSGIDYLWTSLDAKYPRRVGYGPLYTAGGTPEFVRGLAVRMQWLDYKTFTVRCARDTGAETEYSKRMRQLVFDVDHDELVASYFAHAYVDNRTRKLRRVAMAKMREIMLLLKYGREGVHYTRNSTPNGQTFFAIDWDSYESSYASVIGARPYFVRVEGERQ